mmetsp:Transcript_23252/g.33360  ORF Transcript_23252/g.33360 Transcript_23252/m.33360 type:complete len:99 (-) Transcript_23252:352-648(-)
MQMQSASPLRAGVLVEVGMSDLKTKRRQARDLLHLIGNMDRIFNPGGSGYTINKGCHGCSMLSKKKVFSRLKQETSLAGIVTCHSFRGIIFNLPNATG